MSLLYSPTASSYFSLSPTLSSIYSEPPLSPVVLTPTMSPLYTTPVSKVKVDPYTGSTTIYTANMLNQPVYPYFSLDVDTGLNDSFLVQQQAIEYFMYRILDKWLYNDEMCHLLKYLKVSGGKVDYISSENDYKGNKICSDSADDVEKKVDFIHDNLLGKTEMKNLLMRIMHELGMQWYQLTMNERLIVDSAEKYLKKELKKRIGRNKHTKD